jgi:hypothetical protein
LPNLIAYTNSTLLCEGESAKLEVNGTAINYSWSTTENGTLITVTPTVTTIYTVSATDINGCINTATVLQVVDACTGLDLINKNKNKIICFPNPVHEDIFVNAPPSSFYYILDIGGKLIMEGVVEKGEILLTRLPAAIYILKVITSEETYVGKIIKME